MVALNALIPRQCLSNGVPTSVPFTYRDGLTTLQLIECLRHNLDALQAYVDKVKEWAESESDKTDVEISEINGHLTSVDIQIEDILSKLGDLDITSDIYDVTQGRYVNSVDAMRNIYRELAVFGARVDQMATMTAAQAAQHDCITWAVLGNREIFGTEEPRVTPRPQNQRPTPTPKSPEKGYIPVDRATLPGTQATYFIVHEKKEGE